MNKELLNSAQNKLTPVSCFVSSSKTQTSSRFSPFNDLANGYLIQFGENPIEVSEEQLPEGEANSTPNYKLLYRYKHFLGVRSFMPEKEKEVLELGDKASVENVLDVVIEAVLEVSYLSKAQLTQEEKLEFAKQNVLFNAWPYWREYLQNMSLRIGLKHPIMVPFYYSSKSTDTEKK